MKLLSLFRKSDTQLFQEQRRKYLRNLAWQISLDNSEEDSRSYATKVTGYNYDIIDGLEEWDFLVLYEKFRDYFLIPRSFSESVHLSQFKGPIMKGRTPDEIYGYATGKYEGDPNLPWRELYYESETCRITYLRSFATHYAHSYDYVGSELQALSDTGYHYVRNVNPIYEVCDFSVVYNQLTAHRVAFATAVSISHSLTGLAHWHEFGIPELVRREGQQVIEDIEKFGISLNHP